MCAGYGRSVDVIGPNAAKIGARGRKSMAGGPIRPNKLIMSRARAPMALRVAQNSGRSGRFRCVVADTQVSATKHRARFRAGWIGVDPPDKACAHADSHGRSANQPPKEFMRHGASAPSPRLRGRGACRDPVRSQRSARSRAPDSWRAPLTRRARARADLSRKRGEVPGRYRACRYVNRTGAKQDGSFSFASAVIALSPAVQP
jgi:hypothetical protein